LAQNYPNPFSPVTPISYNLPENCHVKLEVFNVLGQKVATLVDERQAAGSKVVTWDDCSRLPDGTYFCRLQAGSYAASKMMMLMGK
jgi:hypothetical protein